MADREAVRPVARARNGDTAPVVSESPFSRTFLSESSRLFLVEDGGNWSVGRLLSLAADVHRALPSSTGSMVAIRSRSTAFIVASLLALWKAGRHGVLLDPALGREPEALGDGAPIATVVSPGEVSGWREETVVRESGAAPLAPRFPEESEPILAFFTSGSTGEPKLVVKRSFQLARQFDVEPACHGLTASVSVLSLVPAHHILGFVYGVLFPAASGGTVVSCHGAAPPAWVRWMREIRPALVVGIPTHYRHLGALLDQPLPHAVYISSGAPLPPESGREFRRRAGWPIVELYGSTESGGVARRTGDGPWVPLPGVQWRCDDDNRLCVASAWQEDPESWVRTDDLAVPEQGGFRLLGRADSVIKVGARRFSTEEVVRAARSVEAVDQAAAVVYSRYGEAAVALFVTPRPGGTLTVAALTGHLRSRLAAFKLPRTLRILDVMPTRGIGKIDLERLRGLVETARPDQPGS